MFCRRLKRPLLVDSGADVSVFPATSVQKKFPAPQTLQAANGTAISTFGIKAVSLALPGLSVSHDFLLADVKKPILGSDFFRANNLLIDISGQCLRRSRGSSSDSPSTVLVKARPARFSAGLCGLRCASAPTTVDSLFDSFPSVTAGVDAVYDSSVPAKHGITHTIPCLLYTSPSPRDS